MSRMSSPVVACHRALSIPKITPSPPHVSFSAHSAQVMKKAMLARVASIDLASCDPGAEDSFFVCDLAQVKASYAMWQRELPMVRPFYAVKCNTDKAVISVLAQLGTGFDCASKLEIDVVNESFVDAEDIVYANPCKTVSHVRHARDIGVSLTTVDNAGELHKLKKHHPEMGVLLRIATDDSAAQCELLNKFGCTVNTAIEELLPLCRELGLPVKGVAFHVGLGAVDFTAFTTAIKESRIIFDAAAALDIKGLDTLDIGGGFVRESFAEAAAVIRDALDEYFPPAENSLRLIAEPGRFMVSNAFSLATHVVARRDQIGDELPKLYINDGVYNNLNCILFDHYTPVPQVLTSSSGKNTETRFSVWGRTCDGLDCVSTNTQLKSDVVEGDWLWFENVGAYTSAASTHFNGFNGNSPVLYVDSSV